MTYHRSFYALIFVSIWLVSASAQAKRSELSQQLENLYSERFTLSSKGVPTVTVGLMDGQRSVSFSCPKSCSARIFGTDGRLRTITLKRKTTFRLRIVRSQPARIRYAVVAFSAPYSEDAQWKRLLQIWKKRGPVRILETGTFFAVRGTLYDTRHRLGVIASFYSRAKAAQKVRQLARQKGALIRIHEMIDRRPSAHFKLESPRRSWFSKGLLELRSSRGLIRIERVEFGRGYRWHAFRTRLYRGHIVFAPDRTGRIAVINRVALPAFLQGLLKAEMPSSAPIEALKAQAVCARNEILAKIGTRHRADPFLFCAHTHCQVYTGHHAHQPRIRRAIRQTRGLVMTDGHGRITDAPFSAMCGGHTEHNEHVWFGARASSLRGRPDLRYTPGWVRQGLQSHAAVHRWLTQPPASYCSTGSRAALRKFRWKRHMTEHQLHQWIHRVHDVGKVRNLQVVRRGVSGRVFILRIVGSKRTVLVHGEWTIRKLFGRLNSSMFIVRPVYNSEAKRVGWEFVGGGWGHGVGMCQYGAMGRAKSGAQFREILKYYYSNIQLRKLY